MNKFFSFIFLINLMFFAINLQAANPNDRNPRENEYGTIFENDIDTTHEFCTLWQPSGNDCVTETGATTMAWERSCDNYLGKIEFCAESVDNPNLLKMTCTDWAESDRSSCPDSKKTLKYRECQDVRYMTTICN